MELFFGSFYFVQFENDWFCFVDFGRVESEVNENENENKHRSRHNAHRERVGELQRISYKYRIVFILVFFCTITEKKSHLHGGVVELIVDAVVCRSSKISTR